MTLRNKKKTRKSLKYTRAFENLSKTNEPSKSFSERCTYEGRLAVGLCHDRAQVYEMWLGSYALELFSHSVHNSRIVNISLGIE